MSVATMVVLLGCSVGCVSIEHHFQRHSVVTHIAEKHAGRYYHCPHCGQIVPREGFNKCPRCFQVPAYHGYEPTCWRQWPQGWGCPPESVVNNPDFWAEGMVESDVVDEEAPPSDEPQQDQTPPLPEEVDKPLPNEEPAGGDVSFPQPRPDLVQSQPSVVPEMESIPEPHGQITRPESAEPVDRPRVAQSSPIDDMDAESSVLSQSPVAVDRQTDPTPPRTDTTQTGQQARGEIVQVKPRLVTPIPVPRPAPVERNEKPAELAVDTTIPAPVRADVGNDHPQGEMVTSVPQAPREAIEIDADSAAPPTPDRKAETDFEIVSRVPVPASKAWLPGTDVGGHDDENGNASDPPSVISNQARMIKVDEDQEMIAQAEAWLKVAAAMAPRATGQETRGPLPPSSVQLAENDKTPPAPRVAAAVDTSSEETYPAPVNRIALPRPAKPQATGEFHPTPVRRIQLSELPIRIQR